MKKSTLVLFSAKYVRGGFTNSSPDSLQKVLCVWRTTFLEPSPLFLVEKNTKNVFFVKKNNIFWVILKFITRNLTKNQVDWTRFTIRIKLHKFWKIFENFHKLPDSVQIWSPCVQPLTEIRRFFGFVANFIMLYLENHLQLNKNRICFEYLLLAKRSFPGSFNGTRIIVPL